MCISRSHLCSSTTEWVGKPGHPGYLLAEVSPRGCDPIFLGVVYRPPKAPFLFGTDFVSELRVTMHEYGTNFILDDFNADQLSVGDDDAIFVRRFIEGNALFSVPYGATHHTSHSDTWLDLCLVDALDTVTYYWKTDTPFIAGHDLLTATLDINIPKQPTSDFSFRDLKSEDAGVLNEYLSKCDWGVITDEASSLTEKVDCLYANLYKALDVFAPLKTLKHEKNRHPWFTAYHRSLLSEKKDFKDVTGAQD